MAKCLRCGKEAGVLGSLGFSKETGRCSKCQSEVAQLLNQFRSQFLKASADGIITPDEWNWIIAPITNAGISKSEALAYVRADALNLLERSLAFASADGYITDQEEGYLQKLKYNLEIPDAMAYPIFQRLSYLKYISSIRLGNLPTIQPSIHLDTDEICHLEMGATYHKVNAKSITQVPGRIIATNKKFHFLSATGGAETTWKNIMRVDLQPTGIYLELSKKTGNGFYNVQDPILAEAVINTLVRLDRRQLLTAYTDQETRHIPHEVKVAVWNRDQGRCVECGATDYLEYDHIIPFSKGGASTVNNIQLLCRKCNLKKGDRI